MFQEYNIILSPSIQLLGLKPKTELAGNRKLVTIHRDDLANKHYSVEFSDPNGDWSLLIGYEKDYQEMDEFVKANKDNLDLKDKVEKVKSILSSVSKFRKSQKRFLYTEEEFNNLFEFIKCKQDEVAFNTKVFVEDVDTHWNIKYVYQEIEMIFKGYKYYDLESAVRQEFKRFLNSLYGKI